MRHLDDLSRERNTAARIAKGTVPRWFAALPCDRPFEAWQTTRDRWGDKLDRQLLVETETLVWEHVYPLERRLITLIERERADGRRCMIYYEQNELRSMARRLEWVLKDLHPWTLPNSVPAEERQQAIIRAVQEQGHGVVIVPYRRVNEGLNLQSAIDSIFWMEMALNLFMLDQASRRAWRLGKREAVRIYYLTYANTAGHHKLRKLGQQSGAAAAFAGEPARGALIEHAGANKTTLARLSSLLEQQESAEDDEETVCLIPPAEAEIAQEETTLKAVFARRAEELRAALVRGRNWLGGLSDTLEARLRHLRIQTDFSSSVWMESPAQRTLRRRRSDGAGTRPVAIEQVPVSPVTFHGDVTVPRESVLVPSVPLTAPSHDTTEVPVPSATSACSAEPGISPQLASLTPVESVTTHAIGSRSDVIFGRREHIALARTRRSRTQRRARNHEPVKRQQPIVVRDIAALTEEASQKPATLFRAASSRNEQTVVTPSLWEQEQVA